MPRRHAGFTLVEMLVALTILAMLGVMGWRGLDQLIGLRTRVNDETADVERVVRVLGQIEFDLVRRVPDALVDGSVAPLATLPRALELVIDADERPRMRILRTQADRPDAIWAGYRLENGVLLRTVDSASATVPADRVNLLDGVSRFDIRVLRTDGWMATKDYLLLGLGGGPVGALEVSIERRPGERYVKVVAL